MRENRKFHQKKPKMEKFRKELILMLRVVGLEEVGSMLIKKGRR